MASKAKVRSMQRGAQRRKGSGGVRMSDIYKHHPPQLANEDRLHLDFVRFSKPEYTLRIREVAEAVRKTGIGHAGEVSRLLNKLRIPSAIGAK